LYREKIGSGSSFFAGARGGWEKNEIKGSSKTTRIENIEGSYKHMRKTGGKTVRKEALGRGRGTEWKSAGNCPREGGGGTYGERRHWARCRNFGGNRK